MHPALRVVALSFLLVVAVSCSSSGSDSAKADSSTTAAKGTTSTTAAESTDGGPTDGSSSGGGFCAKLADEADMIAAFATSIGTPDQAAEIEKLGKANAAIVAAAPDEIRVAVTKIGELSELSRKSLADAGNPDVRAADLAKVTAAFQDPAYKKAIADYTAWVKDNCGDTTAKILSAATGG